jgi:hypothetical protein
MLWRRSRRSGTATYLNGLLYRCTRNGVVVGFLLPPARADTRAVGTRPAAEDEAPVPLAAGDWGVLARARLEALAGLFPGWRICSTSAAGMPAGEGPRTCR